MDELIITPSAPLSGKVELPPSKSYAHRAIICAALSGGICKIHPISQSDDMKATIGAITALGAKCKFKGETLYIDASGIFKTDNISVDFIESGSTMRFLIPIIASHGINAFCVGSGRLPERTIEIYKDLFEKHGAYLSSGCLPVKISGTLKSGLYEMRGDVSSQFITGLLLALPVLEGDSEIRLTTRLESKNYIDITIACMEQFGVEIVTTDRGYKIRGGQKYIPRDIEVESDWSQAAFFFAAGAIGGEIEINNLNFSSKQGDKQVVEIFKKLGADIVTGKSSAVIKKGNLCAIEIDASNIPDMVPAIAATAACAKGTTKIFGAARLRIKESDRIKSVSSGLKSLGIEVEELPDGMIIHGGTPHGGEIDCFNDHRIAMAFSVLACYASGKTKIKGFKCINKSYPDFYQVLEKLGGKIDVGNR
jgi:3-phosphoshikimate 1-carboxyvinyltransferase